MSHDYERGLFLKFINRMRDTKVVNLFLFAFEIKKHKINFIQD